MNNFLAIDIGNTNLSAALWTGTAWSTVTRLETTEARRSASIMSWLAAALREWQVPAQELTVGIASVVPNCDAPLQQALHASGIAGAQTITHADYPWPIAYPWPQEIGADRIADAAAAYEGHRCACIVLDFGTATTLDYIDNDGAYHGGPIAPGLKLAQDALSRAAAKLPVIDFADPGHVLPHTTPEAMQAGLFYGGVDAIDGLITRIERECRTPGLPVIATGGLAPLIVPHLAHQSTVQPHLIFDGIRLLCGRRSS